MANGRLALLKNSWSPLWAWCLKTWQKGIFNILLVWLLTVNKGFLILVLKARNCCCHCLSSCYPWGYKLSTPLQCGTTARGMVCSSSMEGTSHQSPTCLAMLLSSPQQWKGLNHPIKVILEGKTLATQVSSCMQITDFTHLFLLEWGALKSKVGRGTWKKYSW